MADSFHSLHYHVVFSTKERRPLISQEHECRLWEYLGGVIREEGGMPIRIGGIENHVHLLFGCPPTKALSAVIQRIKGVSSRWMNANALSPGTFAWQDGYAAYAVSRSVLDKVADYVARQRDHHRTSHFEDEYRKLLVAHGIDFNERYVF